MSEEARDALVKRVKRLMVELDELVDEIETSRADEPGFWTEFDVTRTCLDLKTATVLLGGVVDKLMQVGRWREIMKPGATWASVKKKIKS